MNPKPEETMSETNGTMRRKPQLSDSIERLDEMIDGLAVAIPGAVAESLREALGAGFAAAIKDTVTAAVAEAFKNFSSAIVTQSTVTPPAPPAPPARPPARDERRTEVLERLGHGRSDRVLDGR